MTKCATCATMFLVDEIAPGRDGCADPGAAEAETMTTDRELMLMRQDNAELAAVLAATQALLAQEHGAAIQSDVRHAARAAQGAN